MRHRINFKIKVYEVVRRIPEGQVATYSDIAHKMGCRAYRAVGSALNKNRDPKVSCHRVIKSNGEVGGYRWGTDKKITLLKKEGIIIKHGKITLRPNT